MLDEEVTALAQALGIDTSSLFSDFWTRRDYDVHPLFRDTAPSVEEVKADPLLSALAATQNDDDATAFREELQRFKAQGNDHFARKTATALREAIASYTSGLTASEKVQDGDVETHKLRSQCFANRATCHFRLGDFVSCLNDARGAIRENPANPKGYWHASRASLKLHLPKESLGFCDLALEVCGDNDDIRNLREELAPQVAALEARKMERRQAEAAEKEGLATALVSGRRFKYDGSTPPFSGAPSLRPQLLEAGVIGWPLLFLAGNVIERVECWDERLPLQDVLEMMFPAEGPFAEWDVGHEFVAGRLALFHCQDDGSEVPVALDSPLKNVLNEGLKIIHTYPCFLVKPIFPN
eukprot:Protomagalhaensia_wolfi_Nauph_80__5478@NODE_59_length_4115_cov_62_940628_g49_i0_p1_GENE_NODE_59_length_4115_cov_62_940628_g49_i0NODE_59_length_4115_cov_62_940628_g49_i0_p1_ORF_typecomplete_len354_score47_80BTAD/PF03704_17/7_5e05BTAD/PF03704_17/2_3e03ANAPC3/PF12895_7/0_00027DUF3856/PF12968_7/0_0025DUF3856/PF12968_7/6_5e02Fis1_TPR_C/PF14853_6/8_8Fis1_TPR_C/PF14853_6/37AFOR_C/PF01314_18/2_3e03AFOR_C/PF01314_18/0_37_NODE_59_length_4115_cov_62_940628_g49_i04121473